MEASPTIPASDARLPLVDTALGDIETIEFEVQLRHPNHYYEDGNVIFVVENTLFRLYRGLLARHSDAMAGMFELPSSGMGQQERIDGVPAIELSDKAEDFSNLLDFLLAPNVPPYPPPTPSFEVLISVLRMSSKYIFDNVRETAIWHLRQMLPTTLEDFCKNPGLTMFTDLRAAQAICAAREFNLPEFLPLAMYAITTYDWRSSDVAAASAVHSILPPDDMARTIVARSVIYTNALKMAYTMHEHGMTSTSCSTPISHSRTCAKGKPASLWMNPPEALQEFLRNPLRQLAIRESCEFHALCRPCVDAIRMKMAEDMKAFFALLPQIFQLAPFERTAVDSLVDAEEAEVVEDE